MIDKTKISNVVIEDIDMKDCPDFCDANITSADVTEGDVTRELTDKELDEINEDGEYILEEVHKFLY